MNIAYTVRRSFPGPGGIATALRVTAAELAKHHRVRVWAARIDDEPISRLNATLQPQSFSPFWLDNVEVRPVPMDVLSRAASSPMALLEVPGLRGFGYQPLRRLTSPAYVRTIAPRLSGEWGTPDVVHAWGGEHLNWAAGHAARAQQLPLVVTPFAHPKAWGDDDMNAAFYRSADRVLALLPTEGDFYGSLGVEEDRVRVVGVPVTPLPDDGPDVRAQHKIGEHLLVLYFGVKEPYKGYPILLEAARHVWAEHPHARVAFVGPRTAASERDFAAIDDKRIIEVGRVDDAEARAWQRAANVLCLPSTSEIMPVTILECWSAGVPVVAAEWWCARDLIDDGRDGIVTTAEPQPIARAIVSLLADPAGAKTMGKSGYAKVVEKYSPQAVAARHESAYREIT
ncbi:MAG: glycosyltransferase family 4 protein [Actinomycetota bacterium]